VALSAAAAAICLLPTACGSAATANGLPGMSAEQMSQHAQAQTPPDAHAEHSAPTGEQVVVVPVGVQSPAGADDRGQGTGGQWSGASQPDPRSGNHEHGGSEHDGDQNRDDQNRDNQNRDNQNRDNQGGNQASAGAGGAQNVNGLDLLGRDCSNSPLPIHDGFQAGPRCIETQFGEVSQADKGPQLLITNAPGTVEVGEEFTLTVSTRNLVRDRFLGAAAGGYYLERSFLNEDGLQRGHFHSACRMLDSTEVAPEPEKADFFLATQDNGGGAAPDTVDVTVTGLPSTGTAQCAVWAGDGSHRVPMMELVDEIPAFDTVRITVA
jgi:hypothetical protein